MTIAVTISSVAFRSVASRKTGQTAGIFLQFLHLLTCVRTFDVCVKIKKKFLPIPGDRASQMKGAFLTLSDLINNLMRSW